MIICIRCSGLLLCAVWVFGCGYHPLAVEQRETKNVLLSTVENSTPYDQLAAPLTSALRSELRSMNVRIVSNDAAHAVRVTVQIFAVTVNSEAIEVVDNRELPVNRKWQMDILLSVMDHTGKSVYGPKVVSVTALAPVSGKVTGEMMLSQLTRQRLLQELAQRVALIVRDHL